MFARNRRNPRAADPELDKKSLASLGITFTSRVGQEPETSPAVNRGRNLFGNQSELEAAAFTLEQ
jgi:hypothetical protein